MAKVPKASELRTLVRWERFEAGSDTSNKPDRWWTIGKLRVKVEGKSGGEQANADAIEAINGYVLWCRYEPDIRPEDRLVEAAGHRRWNVVGQQNFEDDNRWTRIDAVLSYANQH